MAIRQHRTLRCMEPVQVGSIAFAKVCKTKFEVRVQTGIAQLCKLCTLHCTHLGSHREDLVFVDGAQGGQPLIVKSPKPERLDPS